MISYITTVQYWQTFGLCGVPTTTSAASCSLFRRLGDRCCSSGCNKLRVVFSCQQNKCLGFETDLWRRMRALQTAARHSSNRTWCRWRRPGKNNKTATDVEREAIEYRCTHLSLASCFSSVPSVASSSSLFSTTLATCWRSCDVSRDASVTSSSWSSSALDSTVTKRDLF